MDGMKRILSYVRRGVDDYEMIKDGDRVAVGVSAGKDSLTLLYALAELKRFYPKKFDLCAITVDMGFEGTDFTPIKELCDKLGVEYHVVNTEISKVIFDIRKEKNPCSLCAKMRRGSLYGYARDIGCTTVALGHHFDDVVETFMLNLFYEGRLGCFQPVTYLSNTGITLIRPMIYMPEKDIRYFVGKNPLPVIKSSCPADGNTEREKMKQLIRSLERENRGLRCRIYGAIQRAELDGFKTVGRMNAVKDYEEDDTNLS